MLPPKIIRRLVLAPLVVVIAIAVLVLFPLLAVLSLIAGTLSRSGKRHSRSGQASAGQTATDGHRPARMRTLRLAFFALVWLFGDSAALFMCLGLWLVSGFGGRLRTEPYQERHYAIMRWFLDLVYGAAVRAFGLRVEIAEPEPTEEEQAARLTRPVIVLSRHAGPGDSFLLVHQLLTLYRRRPTIVLKATMQLDPGIDVVMNRLPHVFVKGAQTGGRIFVEQIERLASGLDQAGALVIFPEGGNWTPNRWERAISRLEQRGRRDLAARAREMPNLLAPRSGGAFAAIDACPAADVIFVAHAGLDRLVSIKDIWRNLPIGPTIRAKWWRVPAGEVPRNLDHEAQLQWLYGWWERIDDWISVNRPGSQPPPAAQVESGQEAQAELQTGEELEANAELAGDG
jgi:1-acyl-sn-glycerol-3-phosphate acyltransferase